MDFSLKIGTITKTIDDYISQYSTLGEQRVNVSNVINKLSEQGWLGEAKDKFLEVHQVKLKLYEKLEEDMKTMINILKDEKQRALILKQRSEGFINCIKRNGAELPSTDENSGMISLEYSGQFPINFHVNNCTTEDYVRMTSNFNRIEGVLSELEYTSFGISGEVESGKTSVREQIQSLTEFNNSFNIYCYSVKDLESYICSQFYQISKMSEGTFKSSSIISPSGDIDKNQLRDVMLKNGDALIGGDKEALDYIEKVLGEDEYNKLKALMLKNPDDLTNNEKQMLENLKNIYNTDDLNISYKKLSGDVNKVKIYSPIGKRDQNGNLISFADACRAANGNAPLYGTVNMNGNNITSSEDSNISNFDESVYWSPGNAVSIGAGAIQTLGDGWRPFMPEIGEQLSTVSKQGEKWCKRSILIDVGYGLYSDTYIDNLPKHKIFTNAVVNFTFDYGCLKASTVAGAVIGGPIGAVVGFGTGLGIVCGTQSWKPIKKRSGDGNESIQDAVKERLGEVTYQDIVDQNKADAMDDKTNLQSPQNSQGMWTEPSYGLGMR